MLTILARSVILFAAALAVMRMMGKRQVGQLQPYELVVVIMIAELAAAPMGGSGIPVIYGLIPMAAMMICHGLITFGCMRSKRFRAWMCGQPAVLIRNGVICEKQMRKMALTLNDLMEAIRTAGMLDPLEVGTAVMETGGQVTVFPKAAYRSVCPDDLSLNPVREGLPLPLVLDGKIQTENLRRGALTEAWLTGVLRRAGYAEEKQVFFACLNTQGRMLVQGKGKNQTWEEQVIDPEKAVW